MAELTASDSETDSTNGLFFSCTEHYSTVNNPFWFVFVLACISFAPFELFEVGKLVQV